MSKSIYVGNLPWAATEEQVQDLFAEYGKVLSVKLVSDRETGRARGFGFVEMEDGEAQAAIEALDNYSFGGRTLRVNEAPRPASSPLLGISRGHKKRPGCIASGAFFVGEGRGRTPPETAHPATARRMGGPLPALPSAANSAMMRKTCRKYRTKQS